MKGMGGQHKMDGCTAYLNRRAFVRTITMAAAGAAISSRPAGADLSITSSHDPEAQSRPGAESAPASNPDFSIDIAEIEWELSPKKKIRTTAYGGQIPGKVLRVTEGRPVTIEIANRTSHEEIVHWHGQWIPSNVDGSMEEGTPMIAPGGRTRIAFTPKPSGL